MQLRKLGVIGHGLAWVQSPAPRNTVLLRPAIPEHPPLPHAAPALSHAAVKAHPRSSVCSAVQPARAPESAVAPASPIELLLRDGDRERRGRYKHVCVGGGIRGRQTGEGHGYERQAGEEGR